MASHRLAPRARVESGRGGNLSYSLGQQCPLSQSFSVVKLKTFVSPRPVPHPQEIRDLGVHSCEYGLLNIQEQAMDWLVQPQSA